MLQRFAGLREKRRAQSFLKNVRAWYETSKQVSDLLGDALYNEKMCSSDIALVLDKIDRMLFALGFYIPDARGLLRRRDPALAQRLDKISTNIYRLRNATFSFLIRCHGPGLFSGREDESGCSQMDYYRALEDSGFNARQINREVEKELKSLWIELQRLLVQAEQQLAI